MGASWPDDDFDDVDGLVAFLRGDNPIVETDHGAPLPPSAPKASVENTAYERDEREAIQGTAAVISRAQANGAPKAETKPPANTAKTSAPKAKPREKIADTTEDEFDADPSLRPNPKMVCKPGAEHDLTERGKLLLDREKNWYARGPEIVTTIRSGEKGSIIIAPVAYSVFFSRFTGLARWGKFKWNAHAKAYEFVDIAVPDKIGRAIFDAKQWPNMRHLRLVVDTPIIRPDGTIFQEPGQYDPVTQCYYAPTIEFPFILIDATHEDAKAAMQRLRDIFRDFKYTKADMDAVVISAIMSLVGRSAIEGPVPGHLFNAPQRGTGKSLQMDVASQIAFGHRMQKFHLPMAREDDIHESDRDEEQEKRLASAAREGARGLFIDNVKNGKSFGGPVIDGYVAAYGDVKVRILGKTETPVYPWFGVFLVSGNNVIVIGDTRRRFLESMLSPDCARPDLRDHAAFKYDLVGGFALEHRAEIIADILTILVAHAWAGRPRGKRADVATFTEWQRVIADAMVWAGGPDPSQFFVSRSDESDPEEIAIMQAMRYLYSKGAHPGGNFPAGLTCKEMADELFSKEWINREGPKDALLDPCRDALLEVVKPGKGKRYPDGRDLGYSFRAWKGRLVEGADIWGQEEARARYAWRIVGTEGHGGTLRWSVEAKG